MKPRTFSITAAVLLLFSLSTAQQYQLLSPDKKTKVVVRAAEKLSFTLLHGNQTLISESPLSMELDQNRRLGISPKVRKTETRSAKDAIYPVVPEKRKIIPDIYNELEITFAGDYGVRFRAYDDGVAYRFFTSHKGTILVLNEEFCINFSPGDSVYFPEEESFMSHNERAYKLMAARELADTQFCSLPALIATSSGVKLFLSEADLLDYPGLWLRGSGDGTPAVKGIFPHYPLEETLKNDRDLWVTKAAEYIAQTSGPRPFPWRVIGIAEKDGDLLTNDIVYRLASPLAIEETDWIRPGKVAWDWWNANNVYGVDFKAGINTATYKHYIDFASRNGIEYIILDEGWTVPGDLDKVNPDVDMKELFKHAEEKRVGIILWMLWNALDKDMDRLMDRFVQWGAKGLKVDFMQRDDQKMVNFYERTVKAAAKRRLLVDFHGAYKPTGLRRAYPNLITREGVRGLEWNKWSAHITPTHDVTLPFIRMVAGPMDYTPGAMLNATKDDFRGVFSTPMSQGTRCHQLAMYVVYESPLQMLADSPTHYSEQPECMEFLAAVPTVWDEIRVLNAKVGEYLTVARRRGDTWYIGSMTNWTSRDFEIDLTFLSAGTYTMTAWADGVNADRYASDFTKRSTTLTNRDKTVIHLAPGGGWAAIVRPVRN